MRRLAVLALVLLLASPAGAQSSKLRFVEPPTASKAGLKGAQEAKEEAPEVEAPSYDFTVSAQASDLPPSLAFTRPLPGTDGGSAGSRTAAQCRTACAQSRYFCLAEADEETCSPHWARCVAGCS
jgi:hypothetical protein